MPPVQKIETTFALIRDTPDQIEESQKWDEQIERDVLAGRLDALIAQAIAQSEAGECYELTPDGPLTPREEPRTSNVLQ